MQRGGGRAGREGGEAQSLVTFKAVDAEQSSRLLCFNFPAHISSSDNTGCQCGRGKRKQIHPPPDRASCGGGRGWAELTDTHRDCQPRTEPIAAAVLNPAVPSPRAAALSQLSDPCTEH